MKTNYRFLVCVTFILQVGWASVMLGDVRLFEPELNGDGSDKNPYNEIRSLRRILEIVDMDPGSARLEGEDVSFELKCPNQERVNAGIRVVMCESAVQANERIRESDEEISIGRRPEDSPELIKRLPGQDQKLRHYGSSYRLTFRVDNAAIIIDGGLSLQQVIEVGHEIFREIAKGETVWKDSLDQAFPGPGAENPSEEPDNGAERPVFPHAQDLRDIVRNDSIAFPQRRMAMQTLARLKDPGSKQLMTNILRDKKADCLMRAQALKGVDDLDPQFALLISYGILQEVPRDSELAVKEYSASERESR